MSDKITVSFNFRSQNFEQYETNKKKKSNIKVNVNYSIMDSNR